MMDYLEILNEVKQSVNASKDINISHKLLLINLILREVESQTADEDIFIFFFEDVTSSKVSFDFKKALTLPVYELASKDAENCISAVKSFKNLEENNKLTLWLQSALKFTDHLALHYLQVIVKEVPVKQGDAGKERSRYIQINQKKNDAEKAGRILDNLYECRNKLEHRTVSDPLHPGNQKILPPNYKRTKKQILLRYPEALKCFQDSFAKFHK
jgi:hypothetical protein